MATKIKKEAFRERMIKELDSLLETGEPVGVIFISGSKMGAREIGFTFFDKKDFNGGAIKVLTTVAGLAVKASLDLSLKTTINDIINEATRKELKYLEPTYNKGE